MATTWPYKLSDYSAKYVEHLKKMHGDDPQSLIELLEGFDLTPADAPHDMLEAGPGNVISCLRGRDPETFGSHHLGTGYGQIAINSSGEFWFESSQNRDEDAIVERLEWCRTMCMGEYHVRSWAIGGQDDPMLVDWFVSLTTKQDAAAYKLAWHGN